MTSSELVWVDLALVLIIHERSLAHHGGAEGIRDSGALESALALPQNLSLDESPSLSEPAANYLFGMVKNHAFVDGNKRTAWVTARTFLALNASRCSLMPWKPSLSWSQWRQERLIAPQPLSGLRSG